MSDAVIGALVTLLVGAAVLGRIEGRGHPLLPVGDRVAAGLIAACLLLSHWKVNTSDVHAWLPVATAAPLVFYSIVLAWTDKESWFTRLILVGLLIIFVSLAVLTFGDAPDSAFA